jgi:hypothetical protein
MAWSNSLRQFRIAASLIYTPAHAQLPPGKFHLNRAGQRAWRRRLAGVCSRSRHPHRQQTGFGCVPARQQSALIWPPPGEYLVGVHPVCPRHPCHRRTRHQAFFHNLPLQFGAAVLSLDWGKGLAGRVGFDWPDESIVQQTAAQIPWFHNCVILDRVKSPAEREWYIRATIQNGWSRNVLVHQMESGLYHRQGKAATNFTRTLPSRQSELAQEVVSVQFRISHPG